jgi:HSP20 family protein
MAEKIKPLLAPAVCVDHDRENYSIQIELPGVKKDDIVLEISEQSFCVKGSRTDADLAGCYFLAHSVNADKAKAKFESGLLNVTIPLKQPLVGKKIPIE